MKLFPDCEYFGEEREDPSAPVECEYCYRYDICKKAFIEEMKKKYHIKEVDGMWEVSYELSDITDSIYNYISQIRDNLKELSQLSELVDIPIVTSGEHKEIKEEFKFTGLILSDVKKRYDSRIQIKEGDIKNGKDK